VAAFYRALHVGPREDAVNPMFYVSSSPWNLYDLLCEFFHLQDIPLGPVLFLRNWGISEEELLPVKHRRYKLGIIRQMLEVYDDLPFILLGDSGQEDPEIYAEIVEQYAERVLAVYIRNVSRHSRRQEEIALLAKRVLDAGSTMVLGDDSLAMAEHAADHGWIAREALDEIDEEKHEGETPPTGLQRLLGQDEEDAEGATVVLPDEEAAEVHDTAEDMAAKDGEDAAMTTDNDDEKEPSSVVMADGKRRRSGKGMESERG
jgi:hypothetical protein